MKRQNILKLAAATLVREGEGHSAEIENECATPGFTLYGATFG